MRDPTEIVMFEQAVEQQKQTQEDRVKAILDRDFDEFKKMRAYVLKNIHKLRGHMVPIEVMGIQSLPSHECIIINDLLLVSYTEAAEMIREIEHARSKSNTH